MSVFFLLPGRITKKYQIYSAKNICHLCKNASFTCVENSVFVNIEKIN